MRDRRADRLLYFLPVALAACALSFWMVADPDVFWHLESGLVMLDQGRLITHNTFSSVFPDHPWRNNEWLFQVLLAGAYRVGGGWAGVAAFKIAAVLVLGALLYGLVLRSAGRPLLAAAGATTALAIMQHRLTERPHLLSYIFLGLVVLLVTNRGRSPRGLLALPPLFAVWSNTHPEVSSGLLYLGVVVIGELIDSLVSRPAAAPDTRRLGVITLLCAGATLLNPWGYHILLLPLGAFAGLPSVRLGEFAPSAFADFPTFWAFLGLTLLLVLLARPRRGWAQTLPVFVFGLLAAYFQRAIPLFLLVALPVAYRAVRELSERSGARQRTRIDVLCALAAYAALIWALGFEMPGLYRWGWGVNESRYPAAAADLLRAEPWSGNLYNPYNEGAYLIYRLHPRLGVLQDGRGGLVYPNEFIRRLNDGFTASDLPRIFSDYGINIALFRLDEVNPDFDRKRWGVVFWDDEYCLMVRRDSPNREILERLEYRLYLPGVDVHRQASEETLAAYILEMEKNQAARRLPSAVLANSIGYSRVRQRNLPAAEKSFREAVRIDGEYAPAWANLGFLLADGGNKTEAAAALTRAVGLDAGLAAAGRKLEEIRGAANR